MLQQMISQRCCGLRIPLRISCWYCCGSRLLSTDLHLYMFLQIAVLLTPPVFEIHCLFALPQCIINSLRICRCRLHSVSFSCSCVQRSSLLDRSFVYCGTGKCIQKRRFIASNFSALTCASRRFTARIGNLFQSCITVTLESTFYLYLLKQLFQNYFLRNQKIFDYCFLKSRIFGHVLLLS